MTTETFRQNKTIATPGTRMRAELDVVFKESLRDSMRLLTPVIFDTT